MFWSNDEGEGPADRESSTTPKSLCHRKIQHRKRPGRFPRPPCSASYGCRFRVASKSCWLPITRQTNSTPFLRIVLPPRKPKTSGASAPGALGSLSVGMRVPVTNEAVSWCQDSKKRKSRTLSRPLAGMAMMYRLFSLATAMPFVVSDNTDEKSVSSESSVVEYPAACHSRPHLIVSQIPGIFRNAPIRRTSELSHAGTG